MTFNNSDIDLTRSFARKYMESGWVPIGYAHGEKRPQQKGWQTKRHEKVDIDKDFTGRNSNVGILLGEPSNNLVDVDLDCPEAVRLAPELLPTTGAIFGRASKPDSHYLYVSEVPSTVQFTASSGMVVELRSTGGQTMFPPSVHPLGERVEWASNGEATEVPASAIERYCATLAFASLVLRSWRDGMRNKLTVALVGALLDHGWEKETVEKLLGKIYKVAGDPPKELVKPEKVILYAQKRAEAKKKRVGLPTLARLLGESPDLLRDWIDNRPETDRGVFPSSNPILLAREFAKTLDLVWHWRGDFYQWTGCWWVLMDEEELRGVLYPWLENVRVKEKKQVVPVRATRTLVSDILSALAGVKQLPNTVEQPFWIEPKDDDPNPSSLLAFRNGVLNLDVSPMVLSKADPRLFALHGIDCDYIPSPMKGWESVEYRKFKKSIFPSDEESADTVDEICGYLLSSDTSLQKAFAWIGDKRSGKGTIGRVLRAAVGTGRFINPTLRDFGETFGPANMIGKSVAMVSDTRGVVRSGSSVVETILTVTGEDSQSIQRKFKSAWNGVLPTRLLFLSNEPLDLKDPTGVVISRLITVVFGQSFYGKEDPKLTQKLLAELPGIVNSWLDGLQRLRRRGHFIQPKSAADVVQAMDENAGLVRTFVDQECVVGPDYSVSKEAFRLTFGEWAKDRGHHQLAEETITKQLLGLHRKIELGRSRKGSSSGQLKPVYHGITTYELAKAGKVRKGTDVAQLLKDSERHGGDG